MPTLRFAGSELHQFDTGDAQVPFWLEHGWELVEPATEGVGDTDAPTDPVQGTPTKKERKNS